MQTAHDLGKKERTGDVLVSENVNFAGLLLSEPVLHGLTKAGFQWPSPIQLKAIPLGRCGLDLIVQAKSGTGKTCVFTVVALESITLQSAATQVLVLAPTREIAVQIWEVVNSIGCCIEGLRCHTFIGGLPLAEDKQKLRRCHIAIGTPGRIKQLIEESVLPVENIRLFVLDEADKLLENNFQDQINWIYSSLSDNKQMLALSATYPEVLAQHLRTYMRNPTFVRLNSSDPALLGIRQYYKLVPFKPLVHQQFREKHEALKTLLASVSFHQCLVFSNYQVRAESLCQVLNASGWPATFISGSQDQQRRLQAMAQLKQFKCRVLVTTDLTARGIDAENVNLVVNLDIPKDHETYLHRIGRAGRFGSYGAAVTLVAKGGEQESLKQVERKCNTLIKPLPDPVPVDLTKSSGYVSLDALVTTEQILTTHIPGDGNTGKVQPDTIKTPQQPSRIRNMAAAKSDNTNGKPGGRMHDHGDDIGTNVSNGEKFSSAPKSDCAIENKEVTNGSDHYVTTSCIPSYNTIRSPNQRNYLSYNDACKSYQSFKGNFQKTNPVRNETQETGSKIWEPSDQLLIDIAEVTGKVDLSTEETSFSHKAFVNKDADTMWTDQENKMFASRNHSSHNPVPDYEKTCNILNGDGQNRTEAYIDDVIKMKEYSGCHSDDDVSSALSEFGSDDYDLETSEETASSDQGSQDLSEYMDRLDINMTEEYPFNVYDDSKLQESYNTNCMDEMHHKRHSSKFCEHSRSTEELFCSHSSGETSSVGSKPLACDEHLQEDDSYHFHSNDRDGLHNHDHFYPFSNDRGALSSGQSSQGSEEGTTSAYWAGFMNGYHYMQGYYQAWCHMQQQLYSTQNVYNCYFSEEMKRQYKYIHKMSKSKEF